MTSRKPTAPIGHHTTVSAEPTFVCTTCNLGCTGWSKAVDHYNQVKHTSFQRIHTYTIRTTP
jgi:hypothetical protein